MYGNTILGDMENGVRGLLGNVQAGVQPQVQLAGMSQYLQAILKELKQLNNVGQPYVYISDIESVPTSQDTEALGDASPVVNFQTPPLPMILNTFAIGWDTNTAQNFKYRWSMTGLNNANANYIGMSQASLSINPFTNNSIPLPANATVSLYSYNFNSASTAGNLQLYLLGFLQGV